MNSRWARRALAVAVAVAVLMAGLTPAEAAPKAGRARPDVQGQKFVPADPARRRASAAASLPMPDWKAPAPAPAPGTPGEDEVDLTAPAAPTGAHAGLVKVSSRPVWVGPPSAKAAGGVRTQTSSAGRTPDDLRVRVSDQKAGQAVGVDGVLLELQAAPGATAGATGPTVRGDVAVQVDLATVDPTAPPGWAQRAQLVSLPACALTTPDVAACQEQTPVTSTTDAAGTLTTTKVAVASTSATVLAAAAGASGGSGDFRATSTSPSGRWTAGGSGGGFSWSYPLRVPTVAGELMPSLALSYSSDAVDGRTASTNNQPSWVGEGWDLGLGSIERSYRTCEDDMGSGANNTSKRQDLCWAGDNATVSFGSHSGPLVQQGTSSQWRLLEDDGTRFEKLTGALDSGDDDDEYWKVTTTDGTQYFFGRGKATASSSATNSTLVAPVFGNQGGEPCHASGFADSWCRQAWRWNLDHVIDTHGNTMTAYYAKEVNRYGLNNNDESVSYDRAGYLTRIDYGQQDGKETVAAPAQVSFTVAERCLASSCATLDKDHADDWPDVPQDQLCTSTSSCSGRVAPTFFSRKRLTVVKTSVYSGSAYSEVERWTMDHQFPDPGDGSSPALWLKNIVHAGAGGASPLPKVAFYGVQMANRVDGIEDKPGTVAPPLNKWRVKAIESESGGQIDVTYSAKDCSPSSLPSQESNTRRCFPVYWSVPFADNPSLNWFHKYVATAVGQTDLTNAASPPVTTTYAFDGGGGWAYDDNKFIKAKHRTWSQWTGYGKVTTTVGSGATAQKSTSLYYRGLDGDRAAPSGGTKSVKVTDSEGAQVADSRAFRGDTREEVTYDGPSGPEVEASIDDQTALATTATDGDGRKAVLADVTRTRSRTRLSDGSFRRGQTTTKYDDQGFETEVEDRPDLAVTTDHTCTRTTYARNTGAWILENEAQVESRDATCAGWPASPTTAQVLEESRHYYDGLALGGVDKGDETRLESAQSVSNGAFTWFDEGTSTFDAVGRETSSTDALKQTTTTTRTPAGAGLLTSTTTTSPDPDGTGPLTPHVATTTVDPRWGQPTRTVAADGAVTEATYDALGRTSQVWAPGRSKASQTPSSTFAYGVASRSASSVTTKTLLPDETYLTSVQLYDGLLRAKQTQSQTIDRQVVNSVVTDRPGRLVTGTVYDDRGLAVRAQGPTLVDGSPTTSYVALADNAIPTQTVSTYDGAGRVTKQSLVTLGTARWSTTTAYGGDRVMVTPPAGGTATTTISDAEGRTTALRQHTGPTASGAYDESRYSYTPSGQLATMVDAAGNTWRHSYDLLGREVETNDPDSGRTVKTYDLEDKLTTSTDARAQTLAYTYDNLGRKTSLRDGSPTGTLRAGWTYDTVKKNHPASSTRYVDGQPITSRVTSLDAAGRTLASETTVPTIAGWVEAGLAKTYKTTSTYFPDGSPKSTVLPPTGNIPTESLTYSYDKLGRPDALLGEGAWVADVVRSGYGDLLQTTSGQLNRSTWSTSEIDQGTGRTSRLRLDRETHPQADYDIAYAYEDAGALSKISTTAPETREPADTQCFRHDHVQRLVGAWTPSSGDCTQNPATAGLGGPAPYWQEWSLDAASNRTKEVSHAAVGDTTKTWTLPAQGASAVRPHGATAQSTTAPGQSTSSTQLAYDASGDVTGRTSTVASVLKASAQTEALTYDAEGRLTDAKTTGASPTTTRFAYDEDGDRLLRVDPTTTTLYLGDDELTLTRSTGVVADSRYYHFGGRTVAVRTGPTADDAATLWSDLNGTASWQVDWRTLAVSTKRSLPFGAPRGAAPASVRGQHGFVDGLEDAALGLVRLGARDYDPSSGRFLSVDPILDPAVPQQWNPYGYGNGNPVTHPDPTGLEPGDGNNSHAAWDKGYKVPKKYRRVHGYGTGGVNTYRTVHRRVHVTYGWRFHPVRHLLPGRGWNTRTAGPRDRSWEQGRSTIREKRVSEDTLTPVLLLVSLWYGGRGLGLIAGRGGGTDPGLPELPPAGGGGGGSPHSPSTTSAPITPAPTKRLPRDVNVNPIAPEPLSRYRPVGKSSTQNQAVQDKIDLVEAQGAFDVRVNQQQVDATGKRVGVNRPDLQYTAADGVRHYEEYDTTSSNRGAGHKVRIEANDPMGEAELFTQN